MNAEQQKMFMNDLYKLCEENNAVVTFGCGCCGAGIYYKNEDGICTEFDCEMYLAETSPALIEKRSKEFKE